MGCECAYCKNNLPFDLPKEIIDATINGNLVVFAGAGISTETHLVFKETFYEDVFSELELDPKESVDFPQLMSLYCKQKNGRRLLLEKIHNRFEYCQQFDELYTIATKFHAELSSIYSIDSIITTNWDNFFERECNAIPIVTAEDFAFYNMPSRKVFKIHGSIDNYGSIIATNEDYRNCYKNLRDGIVGGYLKTLLATKVIVFVGFSFRDFDFNKIYGYIKKEMGAILPHCYVVTIDKSFKEKFDTDKVTVINTDGAYFFSMLRMHLEGCGFLIPKENLESVQVFDFLRRKLHDKSIKYFLEKKTVSSVYNLFYQDGLKHALSFLKYHAKSGKTFNPHHIYNSIDSYEKIKKDLIKHKNYPTYSYLEGYVVGLHSIFYDNTENSFPFFYIMGLGPIDDFQEFENLLNKENNYHKSAERTGAKYFSKYFEEDSEVFPKHISFL